MKTDDIVILKNILHEKLSEVDRKVIEAIKVDSNKEFNLSRDPEYLVCIRFQQHLDTISIEEVRSGIDFANGFLAKLDDILNKSKGDKDDEN